MREFRWLTNDEIENFVNPVCALRGWAQLNINEQQPTCRVMGTLEGDKIIGFIVLQLIPMVGPLWVDNDQRDGVLSRELTARLHDFANDAKMRGHITVCDNPVSERLAQRYGMRPLESPVYVSWPGEPPTQ